MTEREKIEQWAADTIIRMAAENTLRQMDAGDPQHTTTRRTVMQMRQGDILIEYVPEHEVPTDAVPVPAVAGRLVLAEGEATGHAHTIEEKYGRMVEKDGTLYLLLTEDAPLTHQQHGTVIIERKPGMVATRKRQREYAPEAIRNVAD